MIDANFWGVAPSTEGTRNLASWISQMSEAGVGSVRAFDPSTSTDNLTPLLDSGFSVVGILWWSPPGTPLSMPLADLAGWKAYVAEMVTRYKGKVTHWEVWNEPPNFTEDKTPYAYGQTIAAAYDAAKAVDPTVQIGLAAKSNHVNYLAQAVEVGAANKFDFVTLHPYECAEMVLAGGEAHFMSIVPTVRKMLLDKNPAKANVPVFFTEIGTQAQHPIMQAALLTKVFVMALAQGVSRVYWFDPKDSEGLTFGLIAGDGSKRPAYIAMQTLITYLGKIPTFNGWLNAEYSGFVFNTLATTFLVAWAKPGKSVNVRLLSPAKAVRLDAGAIAAASLEVNLTERPSLLVVPRWSKQAYQWRREVRVTKAFGYPFNGNHAGLQSVSLVPGSADNGIYMRDELPVQEFEGVQEFDATGHDGLSFTVDPAFMSYDTHAVKITAVLRGHGVGDPGFNFRYESNVPLYYTDWAGRSNTDGWHSIKGTAATEKSWIVSNPRFIGMFGSHFNFSTDGAAHADFSIVSLKVEKF